MLNFWSSRPLGPINIYMVILVSITSRVFCSGKSKNLHISTAFSLTYRFLLIKEACWCMGIFWASIPCPVNLLRGNVCILALLQDPNEESKGNVYQENSHTCQKRLPLPIEKATLDYIHHAHNDSGNEIKRKLTENDPTWCHQFWTTDKCLDNALDGKPLFIRTNDRRWHITTIKCWVLTVGKLAKRLLLKLKNPTEPLQSKKYTFKYCLCRKLCFPKCGYRDIDGMPFYRLTNRSEQVVTFVKKDSRTNIISGFMPAAAPAQYIFIPCFWLLAYIFFIFFCTCCCDTTWA